MTKMIEVNPKIRTVKKSPANLRLSARLTARELTARDASALKDIRLKALSEEGQFFGPSLSTESQLSDEQWAERSTPSKDHCYFGLFDKKDLVGILAASTWERDATGQTALWGSAYIRPEYRGKKLGVALYKLRKNWTEKHPHFKSAMFFIGTNNKRSREIHEKQGAEYICTEELVWSGRPSALWDWYKVPVKQDAEFLESPSQRLQKNRRETLALVA